MKRALLVLALAGCHDLPDLGTCGNGIIEAELGEACDGDESGADTCSDTCQLLCQTSAVDDRYVPVGVSSTSLEPLFCPDERMRCGIDGVCRVSSGQFTSSGTTQPFDTKFATSGDFDGDGIDDLIGTSATQIVVRLGSSGAALVDGFAQAAPSSDSPTAIFDRNPDATPMPGFSDIAIGVPTDGLALLSSDTETFGPDLDVTFPTDLVGQALIVVRDPGAALAGSDVVISVQRMGTIGVKRIAIAGAHTELALTNCGGANSQLIAVAISRDGSSFVVVGRPAIQNQFFACRYAPVAGAFQMTQTNFAAPAPDSAVLAQLDDDPCPDLAVLRRNPGAAPTIAFAAATPGTCAFANTLTQLTLASPTTILQDELLAAGSIVPRAAGPERDELVLSSGVYELETTLTRVIAPTSEINPWTTAAIADITGDGHPDVVAGRRGQDDVDVTRGGPTPNVYRADTDSAVIATTAGDFDGDGLGDVALIEVNGVDQQRVSILYGVRDGIVAEPVANSRFEGIVRVARLRKLTWLATTRGVDGLDDLVVVKTAGIGPAETTRGGVLVGDPARLMTVPRIPPFADLAAPQPIGVVGVARFDGVKVVAMALRPDDPAAPNGIMRLATNEIDNATMWVDSVTVNGFDVDPLRPPAVVRTAGMPRLAVFARPVQGQDSTTFALVDLGGNLCTGTVPGIGLAIRAVDLDGDGLDELVINTIEGGTRHVRVVTVSTTGGGCSIGDELFAGALLACSDIVRAGQHVVALCGVGQPIIGGSGSGEPPRSGIFRVDVDGRVEANPAVTIDGVALEILAADFDGDGVPDIAVRIGRAAEVSVQFIKQCPAHDVRGCQ